MFDVPDDVRHESSNDLQTTWRNLETKLRETDRMRTNENEALKSEIKELKTRREVSGDASSDGLVEELTAKLAKYEQENKILKANFQILKTEFDELPKQTQTSFSNLLEKIKPEELTEQTDDGKAACESCQIHKCLLEQSVSSTPEHY